MEPRIETLTEKQLIGKRLAMTLAGDRTAQLWKSFMPRRKEIQNAISSDLYSVQVYDPSYFEDFRPYHAFEKWATIEVTDFDRVPDDMETFVLTGRLYAVFLYKGLHTDTRVFEYIFTSWLPGSGYLLDNRPHFEILGEKYKNGDPNSEEEIWIPIRPKE